ncbi:MAG TPA: hypothetical protein VGB87_01020 [Vicinamibacteria bacterium]
MSLILDALRKLERDKDAREPGVVVVGSVPWGHRPSRRWLAITLAAAALAALLAVGGWLWRGARAPGAPAAAPSPGPALPIHTASPAAAAGTASPPAGVPPSRSLALPVPGRSPEAATEGTEPRPPAAPPGASDDVRLTAISQKDGRPVAFVNDRLVFEGDSFDGIKVLRIGEAEVEVEVRGIRRVLRF